ncbi:PD-(D/E)XK nuclease family protein [Pontibacter chinhatensis]|uniref:PD-(D/E)XK nuclease superfamily protein n=1 Tax=Pontibacter chinhatensis TaxID=1436961 RepID=A0A1I2QLH5_9BACT|nr:PD-(D/E)XK nuclease family protein [Pontibacter chinhatensis]SFG28493.1 PD-(D/E)XK nuclease superfamily protein [Pontibacter chinhatensis]
MTIDFLQELANTLYREYSGRFHQLQIVFPNRRAGLFLLRHLANGTQTPAWAPQVLSMSEFLEQFSDLKRADNLLLCFKLYPIYKELMPGHETFDQFYAWAEIILRDFNNLDQACADAEKVFYHLKDIKALENDDLLSDKQKSVIQEFYGSFHEHKALSGHKERFLSFWEVLPQLYKAFREKLLQEKVGYTGLIARSVAEEGRYLDVPEDKTVLFCGFNDLSKVEEKVIKQLVRKGKARVFWDVDVHLLKPEQEAGVYMRRWLKDEVLGPTFPQQIPDLLSQKLQENIQLTELPLEHVQAREAGRQLQEHFAEKGVSDDQELTRTAVVLPDESQLFPFLYQLPAALEDSTVNVTMGIPLRVTPVYSMLDALLELQKTCDKLEATLFHYKPVTNLLRHPYVRGLNPELTYRVLQEIEQNSKSYVSKAELQEDAQLAVIFQCSASGTGLGRYLLEVLELVNRQFRSGQTAQQTLEEEYISRTRTQLENMLGTAAEADIEISTDLLEKLMRHLLQQLTIPFTGEPLQGLQVMGMLETRCLDFDNLYILSLNEGVLPAASDEPSLIPYFIRSAYGLPTTDEHDAIYAYHFYRLLQRAKKVHLFYSTNRTGGKQGELSRFVRQLLYELWPDVKPRQIHLNAKLATTAALDLKKEEVLPALLKYTDNGEQAITLSPSALNTWLHCRTQFAFRYLIGIKEPDEVQEDVDSSVFGLLMHQVLQSFYEEYGEGAEVTKESIEQKLDELPLLQRVIAAHQKKSGVVPFLGRNSLPLHMVAEMVKQALEVDKAYSPFRIVGLEKTYDMVIDVPYGDTTRTMRLKGHIDRIDEKNGEIRVLDYKTGKDTRAFKTIPELFDRETKDRNKAAMQVLLYSLLYAQNNKEMVDGKNVVPTLYNSKELYSKGFDAKLSEGDDKLLSLTEAQSEEIEQQLKNLLGEVLSADGALDQRKDTTGCEYCGYAGICGR